MAHEHKYFLKLYLAENHIYILADIIMIFPKGKATYICYKAETLKTCTSLDGAASITASH